MKALNYRWSLIGIRREKQKQREREKAKVFGRERVFENVPSCFSQPFIKILREEINKY